MLKPKTLLISIIACFLILLPLSFVQAEFDRDALDQYASDNLGWTDRVLLGMATDAQIESVLNNALQYGATQSGVYNALSSLDDSWAAKRTRGSISSFIAGKTDAEIQQFYRDTLGDESIDNYTGSLSESGARISTKTDRTFENPLTGDLSSMPLSRLVGRFVQGLLGITGVLAAFFIVYGGAKMTIGFKNGSENAIAGGRKTLIYAFFGLVLAFGGYTIMGAILGALSSIVQ